jgi:hypothetical protein
MPAATSAAREPRDRVPWILKPGEYVCDWLQVHDPDSRLLLRLFVNLSIYAKLAGLLTLAFF